MQIQPTSKAAKTHKYEARCSRQSVKAERCVTESVVRFRQLRVRKNL